jgi:hypothetical protein
MLCLTQLTCFWLVSVILLVGKFEMKCDSRFHCFLVTVGVISPSITIALLTLFLFS